jgi:hypothetical protein
MADEASTDGKPTPSRFGQRWPSRRRPAPWFVRFAVTPPSLFATPARMLPQAETGTSRHEDTNVGNQRSLFRRRRLRLRLVPACRSLPRAQVPSRTSGTASAVHRLHGSCELPAFRPPRNVGPRGRRSCGRTGEIAAADFFTTEVWTWHGLVTFYTVFVIELASRRVQILGSTPHPDERFAVISSAGERSGADQ